MSKQDKIQFLYASLGDLQATIRGIDSKVSYLLVVLFLPLTKLGTIYVKIKEMLSSGSTALVLTTSILAFFFVASWLIGFWCALRTLIAIDNPQQHIDGDRPESAFYPASLFRFSFWDVIGRTQTRSITQFDKHYSNIPDDPEEITRQLTLEQMKGMYIAALKIKRSIYAYYAATVWVIVGGVLWFIHLVCI